MIRLRIASLAATITFSSFAADTVPPVLRIAEPVDNLVVTLPGAAAPKPVLAEPRPQVPSSTLGPVSSSFVKPTSAVEDPPPVMRRGPTPILPADFESDSAVYCQKLIGAWTQADAYNLLGAPVSRREAADEDAGQILAYADPTGRYRQIELDFVANTGLLRSVFVYPWKLTWEECRKEWGGNVSTAEANNGRKFHSYADRRLDVLVDPAGKVVSIGLY